LAKTVSPYGSINKSY